MMMTAEARRVAESVRKARLAHWCDHCLHVIQPGQRYRRAFWIIDGEPMVQNTHANWRECSDPNYL